MIQYSPIWWYLQEAHTTHYDTTERISEGTTARAEYSATCLIALCPIVNGDYHDARRSGTTYVTHIERANGVANGDDARASNLAGESYSAITMRASELRRRLRRLDDVELDALCLDHFLSVSEKFSRGMRRDEKVNLPLD